MLKLVKILKQKKSSLKRALGEFFGVLSGVLIMSLALNMFLIPNKLAAGGVSGLGVILFHLFEIPVGLTILAANLPLFIAAFFILGPKVVFQSLLGTVLLPVVLELQAAFWPVVATTDVILAAVYGGVILGVGVGLVFRARGSTGGTSILSLILHKTLGLSTGQGLLGSDLLIIAMAVFVFGGEVAMYAALSLFISSWVIDIVQEGLSLAKAVVIITNYGEQINRRILYELERGVTRLNGRGGYTGQERDILFCVVNRQQVTRLKAIIHEVDPAAFVIVGNASEVHGEGFRRSLL